MRPDDAPNEHVEEGIVHAWLDGALRPDESARVEAHVAACAACSAVVAEARGLIAGASRIVGALDEVPGGVIPGRAAAASLPPAAAPNVRRRDSRRWMLRAAAAVVVMAGGAALLTSRSGRLERAAESAVVMDAEESGGGSAAGSVPAPVSPPPPLPAPVARAVEREAAAQNATSGAAAGERGARGSSRRIAGSDAAAAAPAASLVAQAPVEAPAPSAARVADAGAIVGAVTDASGRPVAGARVSTPTAATTSDSVGRFVLPRVPPGRADLVARGIGYAAARETVDVRPGDTTRAAVALAPLAAALSEVVVTGAATETPERARSARRGAPTASASAASPAAASPVVGCWAVRAAAPNDPGAALPSRVRLDAPARPGARWTLDPAGALRVSLGTGAGAWTLSLRPAGDGWSGTAAGATPGRSPARVTLERASGCGVP